MKRLPIYLSGPMGAGKTTVARAVAAKLGVEAVDLDDRVARAAGVATAGEALTKLGEPKFRELEAIEAHRVISEGAPVVALGGGTVTNREVRWALLRHGVLITLVASAEVLLARIGDARSRPLLGDEPRARLQRIMSERGRVYDECHELLHGGDVEEVMQGVLDVATRPPVVVPLGSQSYRMHLHGGARGLAPAHVTESTRLVLVTDTVVDDLWGENVRALFPDRRVDVVLPPGEEHKTIASVERVWDAAIQGAADRGSAVIAVGGGVVGDVAGFAAATLFRGIATFQMPTTLLAMVDSAIGGKTGVDRPDGKNLVGAIHMPNAVFADLDFLSTLPRAERIAGLAEVVKAGYLDGSDALASLDRDAVQLLAGETGAMGQAIRMAATVKAFVVAADPLERAQWIGDGATPAGSRVVLNLGHTLGHAIEIRSGFALRHGEAVSLGLVAALRVAARLGHAATCEAERVTALLAKLGLPTELDGRLDDETLALVARDKKRSGTKIRFALPVAPGDVRVEEIPLAELPRLVR